MDSGPPRGYAGTTGDVLRLDIRRTLGAPATPWKGLRARIHRAEQLRLGALHRRALRSFKPLGQRSTGE